MENELLYSHTTDKLKPLLLLIKTWLLNSKNSS